MTAITAMYITVTVTTDAMTKATVITKTTVIIKTADIITTETEAATITSPTVQA